MIFHLGFELPQPVSAHLDSESTQLTNEEVRIIKDQIRKNTALVDEYIQRLDLLLNKEKYPRSAVFIGKIQSRMSVLMEENDTFRKVLWKHYQCEDLAPRVMSSNDW